MSHTHRYLLRNITALVSAQVVVKVINFAVSIAVVRYLGAQELGRYAYILAFAYPFGVLADFGIATFTTREICRDPTRKEQMMAQLTSVLLVLSGISLCAMLGVAILARHDPVTLAGLALAGLSMLLSAATTPSLVALTAREDLHTLSLHRVVASGVGAAVTFGVLLWGGATLELLGTAAAVNAVMLLLARALAGEYWVMSAIRLTDIQSMIRQVIPFGLLMLGFSLYYRMDMIMLHWLRDSEEVGIYSAAYRFLDAIILLTASLSASLFPRLSNMAARDRLGIRSMLEDTWKPMLALGLPLTLGTLFVATPLSLTLFGPEFRLTGSVLQVLIWGSIPLLLITIPNHALLAAEFVLPLAAVYGASVVINFIANMLLIPSMGPMGAAVATLLCEWLNLTLVFRLIHRRFGVRLSGEGLWRYLLATAGMGIVLWVVPGADWLGQVVLGVLTYAAGLVVLGYLKSNDLLAVKRLMTQ